MISHAVIKDKSKPYQYREYQISLTKPVLNICVVAPPKVALKRTYMNERQYKNDLPEGCSLELKKLESMPPLQKPTEDRISQNFLQTSQRPENEPQIQIVQINRLNSSLQLKYPQKHFPKERTPEQPALNPEKQVQLQIQRCPIYKN